MLNFEVTASIFLSCLMASRLFARTRPRPAASFFGPHVQQTSRKFNENAYKAKKISTLSPTLMLLGIMPFCTFALGTWQLKRLKWKVDLIDELQERLQRSPMTLPGRIECDGILHYLERVLTHIT